MNDAEITKFSRKLNTETYKTGGTVRIVKHDGTDAYYISATRGGYLKLAAILLDASIAPHLDETLRVTDNLSNLEHTFHQDSDIRPQWLARDEPLRLAENRVVRKASLLDKIFGFGCVLLVLSVIPLAIVGLFTIVSSFFHH